jgi:coenzyme F420-0:L-glutamate ligase / coenzyme F420-1:gamma-L-glutamate ligase
MPRKPAPSVRSRSRLPPRFSAAHSSLQIFVIPGLPEIGRGDQLAKLIAEAARRAKIELRDADILVVAQKIVSKAEGQVVRLSGVAPSEKAAELAKKLDKDARLVELILRESRRILRSERVLIVETRHGLVCANAGIDHSNVPGEDNVSLLPRDPDASARRLAAALRKETGKRLGVIVSDTFGRPWRLGLTNVTIGASGVSVLRDLRGQRDRTKKPLTATVLGVADELAAVAGLLMEKASGTPVVVIRGYKFRGRESRTAGAASMIRPAKDDLFR